VKTRASFYFVGALLALAGCGGPSRTSTKKAEPAPLISYDVIPLADGGAYTVETRDGTPRILFVHEAESVQVVGLPRNAESTDIYPSSDGNAYAVASVNFSSSLFLLRGSAASPVREVKRSAMAAPSLGDRSGRFAWTQWRASVVRAKMKAREEAEANEAQEAADRADYEANHP
jgi:hypothetical protein